MLLHNTPTLFLFSPDPNAFFKTLCFFRSQQKSPARKLAAAVFSSLFITRAFRIKSVGSIAQEFTAMQESCIIYTRMAPVPPSAHRRLINYSSVA